MVLGSLDERSHILGKARAAKSRARVKEFRPYPFVEADTLRDFLNVGAETARLVLTFTPAGIDRWFAEILDAAPNEIRPEDVPDNVDEVAARYVATASAYGITFV